jgi:hypothetical protein
MPPRRPQVGASCFGPSGDLANARVALTQSVTMRPTSDACQLGVIRVSSTASGTGPVYALTPAEALHRSEWARCANKRKMGAWLATLL